MILHSFEYAFDDLMIYPGVYANGEADFILVNGKFEMTGLSLGCGRPAFWITVSGSTDPIWKLVEAALLKNHDALMEAYDADQRRQREAIRDSEIEYSYRQ
jgi:hypothetical protein